MTDDYRAEYEYGTPRAYNFFKVKFTVYNKVTDEYASKFFYISCKNGLNWLQKQIPYCWKYPLPRDLFEYTYEFLQVEDNDRIIFHHITTKDKWEYTACQYFLTVCATARWHTAWLKKVKKIFKKFITFWSNRLFINVTTIKV